MIPQETLNDLLSVSDIVDVIGNYIKLQKKGINYIGCCPFHDEKTASFVVSPVKGIYKCYGCGAYGNTINFIKEHESISFPAAAKLLAAKYNILIETNETPAEKASTDARESLKITVKWALNYFNSQTDVNEAAAYLTKRQISKEITAEFGIGYSNAEWNTLEKAAAKEGFSKDILLKAGLIKQGEHNTYDYFRNRIMFPFYDISGNAIGFTGRDISDNKDIAKYLNSPDTDLFNKGNTLFGLYQAKRHIMNEDSVYLVEGNVDVIRLHAMQIKNTVAGSGTALTKAQCMLLKRFTNNVVIVYDADKAGIKATFKNINILLEKGLNVRAVILPLNEDPDSFGLKKTEKELRRFLETKQKDFIKLKFELLKEAAENPAALSTIYKDIFQSIALIPDEITRHLYIKQCVSKFKIDEQLVNDFFKSKKNQPDKPEENVNGWVGLSFATASIKETGECQLTLNYEKLIEKNCQTNENTILHSGKIENQHIQELHSITQNIVLIDSITFKDIENESKIIELGKTLFKKRLNVRVMSVNKDKDEGFTSFFECYVILSAHFIYLSKGDDRVRKTQIEKAAELLSYADNTLINISTSFVAKQFNIKESSFTKILSPFLEQRKTKVKMQTEGIVSEGEILQFDPERLPAYVDQESFRRYGYFAAENSKAIKVAYVFRTDQGGLMTIANFYMEPLFHVYHTDPSKNKRIVQINNGEQNKQFFMELTSDSMVDFNLFKKCLWREGGNVFSKGKTFHFEMILSSLANKFPLTYELNTFGQQHEGFYAFTNAIFSEGKIKFMDEFGLVDHEDAKYYSPAFSKIYSSQRKDDDKYEQDRFFVFKENNETDFQTWAMLLDKVYAANDNGKWALMMGILSAFRSVIYPIDRLFTSLFFTGPTESGKTQIAVSIRSLFMLPEAPLFNLNSGTDAAFFATLERYRDIAIIFEEYNDYQISDIKFQGLKAAVYDGEGKTKRKDATSKDLDISKVNGVPILLGQERPERDDGSLGNRCVLKQVPKKSDWTDEEVKLFQELKRREKNGLSNILIEILRIRPLIVEHFAKQQRLSFKELKADFREKGITVENRITNTVSLFTTLVKVMELFAPQLKLPFTYACFFKLAKEQIVEQSDQILSTNRLSGFFESLEILMLREKILSGRDFKIETGKILTLILNRNETYEKNIGVESKLLYLRINNIHSHYCDLKKTEALKLGNLMTYIKDHPAYIGHVKSTRFEWTEIKDNKDPLKSHVEKTVFKASSNTSAVVFDYEILKKNVNIDLDKFSNPDDVIVNKTEDITEIPVLDNSKPPF